MSWPVIATLGVITAIGVLMIWNQRFFPPEPEPEGSVREAHAHSTGWHSVSTARRDLDTSLELLRDHGPIDGGVCACLRPLPCSAADAIAAHAEVQEQRIADALTAPTQPIPHLASRR